MTELATKILGAARSIRSVVPLILDHVGVARVEAVVSEATARGHFTPAEDAAIRDIFHDYLTARAVVRQTIDELRPLVRGNANSDASLQVRAFTAGYAGACVLVRAGRAIVNRLADHPVVRRKLDEANPERQIPHGQFTSMYRSLTSPINAWRLQWAKDYAKTHRDAIEALATDSEYEPCVALILESEVALDVGVRRYLFGRLRYYWHAWRRRRKSAFQAAMFGVFEGSGRVIAEMRLPTFRKRVNATVLKKLAAILEPGDVIVTRHHDAMSNLFLPGYWPHTAFHIGTPQQREDLGIELSDDQFRRWNGDIRVLEARKDGVLLRELKDTLAVDAVAVIRPKLATENVRQAIAEALVHEGKLYDFAFDFFRSDRLVCSEVVYRAFDGLGDVRFALTERAGRPTLSSEDLLDAAVSGHGFEPLAVFGTPDTRRRIAFGEDARRALVRSYSTATTESLR